MPLAFDCCDMTPAEVRQRFRWAKRQGNPAWLWPDVEVGDWRTALHGIEGAVRNILASGSSDALLDGNPAAFGVACYTSGTGPILGWWMEQGRLAASPAIAAVVELHLRHNRLRAARLEAAAVALVGPLLDQGIDVAILKGMHTAGAYFPDPGTRPASDIDLLVRPVQAMAAEEALRSQGFIATGRGKSESGWRLASVAAQPRSLHMVHADDPWSVDLHSSLNVPVSHGAAVANLDLAKPVESGRDWPACPRAKLLDQSLLLLHLAVHASAGLQNLTLLRLIELHLVIRKDEAAGLLAWESFTALAEQCGSLGFAYPALRLCDELAPGTIPESVLARCARHAPHGVISVLDRLSPATAQRLAGSSVAEHFMWAGDWGARLRQLATDVAVSRSWRRLWPVYERRAWQLLRGRIGR